MFIPDRTSSGLYVYAIALTVIFLHGLFLTFVSVPRKRYPSV
ncbi:hypothetical protein HMPREF1989_00436 [Porphyromonas gingivalis F0566]|nr:hypothetical protein HMPREF1989_00436 [Porphyromonas gingivalis F0566]